MQHSNTITVKGLYETRKFAGMPEFNQWVDRLERNGLYIEDVVGCDATINGMHKVVFLNAHWNSQDAHVDAFYKDWVVTDHQAHVALWDEFMRCDVPF